MMSKVVLGFLFACVLVSCVSEQTEVLRERPTMGAVGVRDGELALLEREAALAFDFDDLVQRLDSHDGFFSGSEERQLGVVKRVNSAVLADPDSARVRRVHDLVRRLLDGEYGGWNGYLVMPDDVR